MAPRGYSQSAPCQSEWDCGYIEWQACSFCLGRLHVESLGSKQGIEERTLRGHNDRVNSIAVDGDRAVSASTDFTVKVWNLKNGENIASFSGDSPLLCCAFGREEKSLPQAIYRAAYTSSPLRRCNSNGAGIRTHERPMYFLIRTLNRRVHQAHIGIAIWRRYEHQNGSRGLLVRMDVCSDF